MCHTLRKATAGFPVRADFKSSREEEARNASRSVSPPPAAKDRKMLYRLSKANQTQASMHLPALVCTLPAREDMLMHNI